MQGPFRRWAILELMGHRQLAGMVSEIELFGTKMCQIDIPAVEGRPGFTQRYGGGAIYGVTECSEETARRLVASFGVVSPDWTPPDSRPQLPPADESRGGRCLDCGARCDADEDYCDACFDEHSAVSEEVISSPEPEATETNLEPPCAW